MTLKIATMLWYIAVAVKVKVPPRFTGAMRLPVIRQAATLISGMESKTLLREVSGVIHPGEMGKHEKLELLLKPKTAEQ